MSSASSTRRCSGTDRLKATPRSWIGAATCRTARGRVPSVRTGWRGPSVAPDAKRCSSVRVAGVRRTEHSSPDRRRQYPPNETRPVGGMLKVGEVSTAVALREIGPYLVCLGTPPFAQSAPLVTHHGERDLGWANGGVPGFSGRTTERQLIHVPAAPTSGRCGRPGPCTDPDRYVAGLHSVDAVQRGMTPFHRRVRASPSDVEEARSTHRAPSRSSSSRVGASSSKKPQAGCLHSGCTDPALMLSVTPSRSTRPNRGPGEWLPLESTMTQSAGPVD